MNRCQNPKCNRETTNPKFCSKSCSTIISNKIPKRKLTRKCLECDEIVMSYRHQRCALHHRIYQENKYQNRTLGEYRSLLSVKGKHPSWLHAHIRSFARSWLKHLTKQPCRHCGYDKHVELAHIKPLAEFSNEVRLSEINSEENVIPLCPNCHWEFDNLPRK